MLRDSVGILTDSKGREGVLVLDQLRAAVPALWYKGQRVCEGTLHCYLLDPTNGGRFPWEVMTDSCPRAGSIDSHLPFAAHA